MPRPVVLAERWSSTGSRRVPRWRAETGSGAILTVCRRLDTGRWVAIVDPPGGQCRAEQRAELPTRRLAQLWAERAAERLG